jgi:hypothetical protein
VHGVELTFLGAERTLRLGVTQSLVTEFHSSTSVFEGTPGERYWDIKNRTDLVLMHGSASLNLRMDAHAFINTEDQSGHRSQASLAKISLSTIQRSFEVTGGDFYIRVGRGLALDLTRVSELSRDTTLRGGQVRARASWISAAAFAGWVNPLAVDDATELPVKAPSDVIYGALVEVRPHRALSIASHYVGSSLEAMESAANATHTIGGRFELPSLWGKLAVYGELNYLYRAYSPQLPSGTGTYASITGNFGPLAVLAELKFYKELQLSNSVGPRPGDLMVYNRAPTLARPAQEVTNNDNVIGPRLRLDLRVGPLATVVYASYAWFFNSSPTLDAGFFDNGGPGHDVFGGIQQPLRHGSLEISGGYRVETSKVSGKDDYRTAYEQAFVEADLTLAVAAGHTLDLQAQYRKVNKAINQFSDCFVMIGYRPSKYGSAAFTYEHSSEMASSAPEAGAARTHFYSFVGTLNFTPTSHVRLLAGSTRGGSRCVDGLCRVVPPFIGTKIELVIQI